MRKIVIVATLIGGSSLPVAAMSQTAPVPPAPAAVPSNPDSTAQAASPDEGATPAETGASADIIVTATRRAQNLQQVPIAISAIGDQALQTNRVNDVMSVQGLVPGLQVNRNNAAVAFTLRGVGTNFRVQGVDTTVALHTDGVYVSSPNAAQAALFDLERIEVVKGPQGVLYGRGASGGAINLISKLPTSELSAEGAFTYGDYNRVEGEAIVSGPLIADKLLFRLGGYYRDHDGFGRNLTLNEPNDNLHEYGFKGTLQFKPDNSFNLLLRGDYYHGKDNSQGTDGIPGADPLRSVSISPTGVITSACTLGGPCAPGLTLGETRGGVIASNPHDTYANIPQRRDLVVYGFSGEANITLTDELSLKLLTGYRHVQSFNQTDNDQTAKSIADPFIQTVNGGQFSQEIQASYRGTHFFGILGAYYFHERRDVYFFLGSPALSFLPPPNYINIAQIGFTKTDAGAVFGNVDIDLTSRLKVGLGARYSSETRGTQGLNAAIFGPAVITPLTSKVFGAFTPRATLDYMLTDDINVYAAVSRGFKSGQFGVAIPQYAAPEFLMDYEGGFKGKLWDGRVRFTAGGFFYHFDNIQLQLFQGATNVITNADTGKAYGAEASVDLQLPAQFRLHVDGLAEHSEYGNLPTNNPNLGANPLTNFVNLKGNRFPYTPEFSYNLSLEKDIELGRLGVGTFRAEDQYNSKMYLDIYQNDNAARPSYHIFNLSYRQQLTPSFSVTLWGRNVTNKTVVMAKNFGVALFGAAQLVNFNDPATFGFTIRKSF